MRRHVSGAQPVGSESQQFPVTFFPMEIGSSSTPDSNPAYREFASDCVVSFLTNGNSPRSAKFSALQQALQNMGRLPQDHDFHVAREAISRASEVLAVFSKNFDIDPPKVLPQDGDAVVFTWDIGDLKRYLTIDTDEVDLMDLHKKLQVRCVHEVPAAELSNAYARLVDLIGAQPISTTMD